ncbi:Uncharacterised protein [Chryseobacterium taihuense]|uniref:Uncharacterized protein n=2 Tax=Chryseobacterium group TaxID=2782232 RepID=A0A4U8WDN8_9FLAO|nr:Uncharacterised protein [Chryseobacterium taihuense]
MQKKEYTFLTSYNQFYLISDKDNFIDTLMNIDEDTYTARLGLQKNRIIIFSQSFSNIKGDIEVLETPNKIDYKKYDHIVEGGIEVYSGELQILSWPGSEVELSIELKPGKYRVRINSANLSSVKETDLAHDTDNDFYHIEIWPNENMELKVLKQSVLKL